LIIGKQKQAKGWDEQRDRNVKKGEARCISPLFLVDEAVTSWVKGGRRKEGAWAPKGNNKC
jgi:hypothetical protein